MWFTAWVLLVLAPIGVFGQYEVSYDGTYSPQYDNPIPLSWNLSELSPGIPIGFDFEFYGNTYSTFYISANGFITFDPNAGIGYYQQYLPYYEDPNNLIAFCWNSGIGYSYGFSYETLGSAPDRTLHFNYYIEGFMDPEYCPDGWALQGQLILFESDSHIEFHTGIWNGAYCDLYSTQGIEDEFGNIGHTDEYRNDGWWDAYGDFLAIIPATSFDIAVLGIVQTVCEGNQQVGIIVENNTENPVTSFEVEWSVNGQNQGSEQVIATLDSYERDTFYIGNFEFQSGQEYEVIAWSQLPNGYEDIFTENDTVSAPMHIGISGIKTIGGTSPDYATMELAMQDLNEFGVCDSVIFNFRPGTYTGTIILDTIQFDGIGKIVFQAETGNAEDVTITQTFSSTGNHRLIKIDHSHNIIFRNLTLAVNGTACSQVIYSIGTCHNIEISGCIIRGATCTSTSVAGAAIHLNEYGDARNIIIRDNIIKRGTYAIRYSGNYPNVGLYFTIKNNVIDSFYYRGVYIYNVYDCDIIDNTVKSPYNSSRGLDIQTINGNSTISGNYVSVFNGTACEIYNYNPGSTGDTLRIFNNMFVTGGTFSNSRAFGIQGHSGGLITHNSFHTYNTSATGQAFLSSTQVNPSVLYNNIFSNGGGSRAVSFSNVLSDNNLFYSATSSLISSGGTNYSSLDDWQMASGLDLHSVEDNPLFVSNTDLHSAAGVINGIGKPLNPPILEDFDKESRNIINPDIGADEIGFTSNDLQIVNLYFENDFITGLTDAYVIVNNFGVNTISNYLVDGGYNAETFPQLTVMDPLNGGATDTLFLGQMDVRPGIGYNFEIYSSLPNGMMDSNTSNDTLHIGPLYGILSGVYTVGGVAPDLSTISLAVSALQNSTVKDSVQFIIRDGIYHQPISITANPTFSCTKPIRFTGETGNPEDILIDNNNLAVAALRLNEAYGIIFENLSFSVTASAFHNAVVIENKSSCNTFKNCHFIGKLTTQTSATYASVTANGTQGPDNDYINCLFKNGSVGLSIDGPGNVTDAQHDIKGNSFENNYYSGLSIYNADKCVVSDNYAYATVAQATNHRAISFSYCYNIKVINNRVHNLYPVQWGIVGSESHGSIGDSTLIYNNAVSIGTGTGLYLSYTNYAKIVNNTSRTSNSYAFVALWNYGVDIRNNIFQALGTGIGAEMLNNYGAMTLDNNWYDVPFGDQGEYQNVRYKTMQEWRALGFDSLSLSGDPLFENTGYKARAIGLNGRAIPYSFLQTDIEKQERDSEYPDLGAYEFDPYPADAGLIAMTYPSIPFISGAQPIYVKFDNNGSANLTSVQFDWTVNNVAQTPFVWTGILESAQVYDSLQIGTFQFEDYEEYAIKIWISQSNGAEDHFHGNDTVEVSNMFAGMHGLYTIGGIDPDFETITAAVAALNQSGVAGATTFNIRNGVYAETILLNQFNGSSCTTPVVFQSESGNAANVTITNLGINAHTVVFNGNDGVVFRNLTITSVNTAFRHVIQYSNGSHCNIIEDNILVGFQSTSNANTSAVIRSLPGIDTANVFRGNIIRYGAYGFYLTGTNGIRSGVIIEQNTFDQVYYYSVYGNYQNGFKVSKNEIYHNFNNTAFGIYMTNSHNFDEIAGNNIIMPKGENGITVVSCNNTSANRGKIYNNFISLGGTSTCRAIVVSSSGFVDILHNNINVYSTFTTPANTAPLYLTSNPSLRVLNNACKNAGAGYAIYSNSNSLLEANNNIYLTAGATFAYFNGGAVETTFDLWKTASGQDAQSINSDPVFMSNTDLHTFNVLMDGVGYTGLGINVDFDGQNRTSPPDIGADEFDPLPTDDAGIAMFNTPMIPFVSGDQMVRMVIKNFGGNPLTEATVRWMVNGVEQVPYYWTGYLPSAVCDTVDLGIYHFSDIQEYTIASWTEMPNGNSDNNTDNDLLTITDHYAALNGAYTIGGFGPDFNLLSDALNVLNTGGVSGPVTFNFRQGAYDQKWNIGNLPKTSYAHTITFQSESLDSSDVIITQNVNNQNLIELNNAHKIKLKHLTLINEKGNVVYIFNGSSQINVENCVLIGKESQVGNNNLIYSTNTNEDSIAILYNRFVEGFYGIYLDASIYEKNHQIIGNTFSGSTYSALFVRNADKPVINNNYIDTESDYFTYIGNISNALTFQGNTIFSTGTGNSVYIINALNTSATPSSIINNYIYRSGGNGSHAIHLQNVSKINIDFNSVWNAGTNSGSSAFYATSAANMNLRNNIFYSSVGPAIYTSAFTAATHNYNDIFSLGPVQAKHNTTSYNSLGAYASATSSNTNSWSIDPLFISYESPEVTHYQLDGTGIAVAGITTDISGSIRTSPPDIGAKEFTPLAHDIKVAAVISPLDGCGIGTESVTVALVNQGAMNETDIPILYKYEGNVVSENTGASVIPKGDTLFYTFTTPGDFAEFKLHKLTIWIDYAADLNHINDTLEFTFENYPPLQQLPGNLIPLNGTVGLESSVSLSWSPVDHTDHYDIYLWPASGSKPVVPTVTGVTTINRLITGLSYGETYNWQVHVVNVCGDELQSMISSFSTRQLPDLVVHSITVPPTAYSEQVIGIEWTIHNQGAGTTFPGTWYDNIYLSVDPTYNSFDPLLGSVSNLNSLTSGSSYNHFAYVQLPQGTNGEYYIIIRTDKNGNVKESDENNNTTYSVHKINVTLSPPPDLIVTEITSPTLAFSGELINITYEVSNLGDGVTTDSIWSDRIELVPAAGNPNTQSFILSTRTHTGLLYPEDAYLVQLPLQLPENIFGDYQIRVTSDIANNVFEFASEHNNHAFSSIFEIILTPPPDLVPDSLDIPDTISLYQLNSISFEVRNDGGTPPLKGWRERIYISPSPVYNTNFLENVADVYHNAGLLPGQEEKKSVNVRITSNYSGTNYFYVFADQTNVINEYEFESNNIIRSQPVWITKPDLRIDSFIVPSSALSGNLLQTSTETVNDGPGFYSGKIIYRYYLSDDMELSTSEDISLGTYTRANINISLQDTLRHTNSLLLPAGIFGNKYLIGVVDASDEIFEDDENNNVTVSSITLFEPPHADLFTSSIQTPDTITAGVQFGIEYLITNGGDLTLNSESVDSIFISFSPSWNRANAVPLGTRTTNLLDINASRLHTVNLQTNLGQNPNIYYIYIVSDARNMIYEGSGESNNILRSDQIVLLAYPEIDLAISSVYGMEDTIYSGQVLTLAYTIQNLSDAPTYFTTWTEKAYLSTDSILNSTSDLAIGVFTYSGGKIGEASSKEVSGNVQIPHGITGDFYVFVVTDHLNVNQDLVLSNNQNTKRISGEAVKVHIQLSPYPDLRPANFVSPVEVLAGQYFTIIGSVENIGTGNSGQRTDRIYLSTNNIIENGDHQLVSKVKSGLAAESIGIDTFQVFVPAQYFGNYYLIYSIDYGNVIFENGLESNNTLLASLNVIAPPPADLIVKNILVPDSVLAGQSATISWITENTGANPANGQFRELVYLSSDTIWQVEDEVIGIVDGTISLGAGSSVNRNLNVPYNRVTNGDYHTIIRTDARNNILESNEDNNLTSSVDKTNVDIEEIFLDTPHEDSLVAGVFRYFKVEVPAEAAGRNMVITLKGDSLSGVNEIYAKYNAVPTEADHDATYTAPFAPDQRIFLRDVVPGYYYILVKGFRIGTQESQSVELLARIINMELFEVTPDKVGNKGLCSIEGIGSELDSIVLVKLVLDDTINYHEIVADTFLIDELGERIIAQFNLEGQPLGSYHYQCHTNTLWMVSVRNAVEIIEGVGADLQVNWDFTPRTYNPRFLTLFQIKIDIENRGDADVFNRFIRVNTPTYDNPVYYTLADYYNNIVHSQLVLSAEDSFGLPGVLKPGGRRTYYVYGRITGTQGFSIYHDK